MTTEQSPGEQDIWRLISLLTKEWFLPGELRRQHPAHYLLSLTLVPPIAQQGSGSKPVWKEQRRGQYISNFLDTSPESHGPQEWRPTPCSRTSATDLVCRVLISTKTVTFPFLSSQHEGWLKSAWKEDPGCSDSRGRKKRWSFSGWEIPSVEKK